MAMARYCLVLILVLNTLFCEPSTGQHLRECGGNDLVSICITNDAEIGCQQPSNVTTSIAGFSQLLMRDLSLKCVKVFFTSGTHLLENSLIFAQNITNIEIFGTVVPQTKIECVLSDGLVFNAALNGCILITNIIFEKCSKWKYIEELSFLPLAIFFQNVNMRM